jgi:hypothetical protein
LVLKKTNYVELIKLSFVYKNKNHNNNSYLVTNHASRNTTITAVIMDVGYTGGLNNSVKIPESLLKNQLRVTTRASNLLNDILISYRKKASQCPAIRRKVAEEGSLKIMQYKTNRVCSNCEKPFNVFDDYGTRTCYAHYGAKDYSPSSGPVWSCCQKKLSTLGCMRCDHFPKGVSGRYISPSPTFRIPLTACLYGLTSQHKERFFLNNYFWIDAKGRYRDLDSSYVHDKRDNYQDEGSKKYRPTVNLVYVTRKDKEALFGLGNTKSEFDRVFIKLRVPETLLKKGGFTTKTTEKSRNRSTGSGVIKKSRVVVVYVNIVESKLSVPLYEW